MVLRSTLLCQSLLCLQAGLGLPCQGLMRLLRCLWRFVKRMALFARVWVSVSTTWTTDQMVSTRNATTRRCACSVSTAARCWLGFKIRHAVPVLTDSRKSLCAPLPGVWRLHQLNSPQLWQLCSKLGVAPSVESDRRGAEQALVSALQRAAPGVCTWSERDQLWVVTGVEPNRADRCAWPVRGPFAARFVRHPSCVHARVAHSLRFRYTASCGALS